MTKIKPKQITITRAEGLAEECNRPVKVANYIAASEVLAKWAATAPNTGGYDKCDFMVEFDDGETYHGRVDLQFKHTSGYHLGRHIRDYIAFIGGFSCPPHLTESEYTDYVTRTEAANPGTEDACRKFLVTYELE